MSWAVLICFVEIFIVLIFFFITVNIKGIIQNVAAARFYRFHNITVNLDILNTVLWQH